MNKQLFFGANVAQNTKANAGLLAAGEVGIFGLNSTTYLEEKVAIGQSYDKFWIAVGRGGGKAPFISRLFASPSKQQLQYKKFGYSPAIAPIVQVSTDCTANGAFDQFGIRISSRFGFDLAGSEKDFRSYIVSGKYATPEALYDAWAEAINNDPAASYTAEGTAGGTLITAEDPDQIIDVSGEYWDNPSKPICATCSDCTITVTRQNEADSGSGTFGHLQDLALECAPYIGGAYYNDRMVVNPGAELDTYISTLGNTDILYIRWKNIDMPKGDHGSVFDVYTEVYIAYPTGTNTSAIETILNSFLGQTIRQSLAS